MRLIIILILLSSCSASKLVQRAKRKDPSIFTNETTIERDTVIKEGAQTSIVLHDTLYRDTVIYKDKIRLEYKTNTITKKVEVIIECPPDSVFIEVVKEKEVIVTVDKPKGKLAQFFDDVKFYLMAIGAAVIVFIIIRMVK